MAKGDITVGLVEPVKESKPKKEPTKKPTKGSKE